jgi:hypothetical protein
MPWAASSGESGRVGSSGTSPRSSWQPSSHSTTSASGAAAIAAPTRLAGRNEPTLTYDDRATSGNRWNVPIGLTVEKTTRIGRLPVKFEFGAEYSVVSQEDFGQRFQFKLNIIPVIASLVEKPILGQ